MRTFAFLAVALVALAGCSGKSGGGVDSQKTGTFELSIQDSLDSGRLELSAVYLHAPNGWVQAMENGSAFELTGKGGNVSQEGAARAGDYDRMQLNFASFTVDGRKATLSQTGIEVAANITVPADGKGSVSLAFSWVESIFESAQGLAFSPVLTRLVVEVDDVETVRLEAEDIKVGSAKAPVARMRVFDSTGLEAFVSTFVADSPEKPVIGASGNITFSATASAAVQTGATITSYVWDIGATKLTGNTVTWTSPIDGGNHTVRLTVTDSEGGQDSQTVQLALKPGTSTQSQTFTGDVDGAGGCTPTAQGVPSQCPPWNSPTVHTFTVNTTEYKGAAANLTHVRVALAPGSATVPYADLDVLLDDAAGKRLGSQTGSGSQHVINVENPVATPGEWKVTVTGDPAYGASYTVTVTLTWVGYNPGMAAFLASYDDGHSHEH